jgi:hypothetical protein
MSIVAAEILSARSYPLLAVIRDEQDFHAKGCQNLVQRRAAEGPRAANRLAVIISGKACVGINLNHGEPQLGPPRLDRDSQLVARRAGDQDTGGLDGGH